MGEPLDEFSLIERYFAPLSAGMIGALRLKDDAATFPVEPGLEVVITTDAIVENIHFLSSDPPETIARKALRVNLSDLAAKGADPVGYLLTLALPRTVPETWLEAFARGLGEDQAAFGVHLAGGDTVTTAGPLLLSVTAFGTVPRGTAVRRVGAQPGDRLFVTGTIGDGLLGLRALKGTLDEIASEQRDEVVARYRLPRPRVAFGPALRGVASAALDVSDGLVADIAQLVKASGVGAVLGLNRIPLSPAAQAFAGIDPERLIELATAGDDYEILFSIAPDKTGPLIATAQALGVPVSEIGAVVPGEGMKVVNLDGHEVTVARPGFRHF